MLRYERKSLSLNRVKAQHVLILLLVLMTFDLFSACSANPQAAKKVSGETPLEDVRTLCDRIDTIKVLPFKDEPVEDPIYNALAAAKEKAFPCLIEKVTDTTPMPDPRRSYKYGDVRVGDVALFVLMRVARIGFDKILPPDVLEKLPQEGVYAYFDFVEKPEHRKDIQNNLLEWYRHKYGAGSL